MFLFCWNIWLCHIYKFLKLTVQWTYFICDIIWQSWYNAIIKNCITIFCCGWFSNINDTLQRFYRRSVLQRIVNDRFIKYIYNTYASKFLLLFSSILSWHRDCHDISWMYSLPYNRLYITCNFILALYIASVMVWHRKNISCFFNIIHGIYIYIKLY